MLPVGKFPFCGASVSLVVGGSWKALLDVEGSVPLCSRSQQHLGRSRFCPLAPGCHLPSGYAMMNAQERLCLKESGVHSKRWLDLYTHNDLCGRSS